MPNPAPPAATPPPGAPIFSPQAAFLSYLVPGLGQIYQGRISKGVFFLVSIYGLFFLGLYLGRQTVEVPGGEDGTKTKITVSNVYIPHNADKSNSWNLPEPLANLYNRPQFLGQFWVGIASWPAIWQYYFYSPGQSGPVFGDFERYPGEDVLNQAEKAGNKEISLGWVYTVIAGVLNVMVIYDALAGPAFPAGPPVKKKETSPKNVDTASAGS